VNILNQINFISVFIVLIIFIPICAGAFEYFSKERIQHSIYSLFDNIEFIVSILLSVFLVKKILIEHNEGIYASIYEVLPNTFKHAFPGQGAMIYLVFVPLMLVLIMCVLRIITQPFYRLVVAPLAEGIYNFLESMNGVVRRIIGAVCRIPKAIIGLLIFVIFLNTYTYYFYSPKITAWMNESTPYQILYKNAIYPVLNSNLAKQIPVIVNDSFRKTFDKGSSLKDVTKSDAAKKLLKELEKRNIKVIEYFNGVTLDEAIKSNSEIDNLAKKIVADEKVSTRKGYLLYKWVSKNIKYDYDKAEKVSKDPRGIESGAITAFETRKGICFDYSSLYVAMCRAVGLKVRLVTGLGYSGTFWGDHAWNQVYSTEEKRWINVDCTFGSAANYFDKKNFDEDHKDSDVQGEW
jgi:hypothetical protein